MKEFNLSEREMLIQKNMGPNYSQQMAQYEFAYRLSELVNGRYTLDDIAEKTGLQKSSLSSYATGKTVPGIIALSKLADYFKVSADYLLGLTDTKTIVPTPKSACEYTRLSDEAAKKIRDDSLNKDHPLYRRIASYLIANGYFSDIVNLIEKSLIAGRQYSLLYGDGQNDQRKNLLDTLEFQFNQTLVQLYSDTIAALDSELSGNIDSIVSDRWQDFLDAAAETRDKMEAILSDDTLLALQAKQIQTAPDGEQT